MPDRLKIYVVDDEMQLCQDLRNWLSDADHEVMCSPAGQTQTHTLLQYQPHLIVMGMTRYAGKAAEVYGRLINHRQLSQVPMIVVSDDASLEYEMLDAFDFQVRPFDRERLATSLQRISDGRQYQSKVSLLDPDLSALKRYLLDHSGLHFSQHNHRILERGLMRRIQALRMESLPAYFHYLTASLDNYDELSKLLGLLTVGETSFFRYRSHREALLKYVIPKLIEQNRAQEKLRIWSAGCSTGEEPYSLAILLLEHFPEVAGWDIQILATDINKRSLRQAREGIYGVRSLRMMSDDLRDRYFHKTDNLFLLSAQIRRMVKFDYLNLQTDHFPDVKKATSDIDLLSCRNVLIYFELDTIRRIIAKFGQALRPQGYLFLGHAETMQNVSDQFQRHHQNNAFFYQLKDNTVTKSVADKEKSVAKRFTEKSVLNSLKSPVKKNAVAVGSAEKSSTSVTKVIEGDPEEIYSEALAAFDHEKFSEAGVLFDLLLEQQPTKPKALVGKGLLLANQGKYRDARIYCARAIKEDDLLPEAYLLRGLILDMEDSLERALVEYQKVLWLDPSFVMAHYLSAKVYDRCFDKAKKERSLRNTVRVLEQASDQSVVPFSGGLTRGVFLEIVRRDLVESANS